MLLAHIAVGAVVAIIVAVIVSSIFEYRRKKRLSDNWMDAIAASRKPASGRSDQLTEREIRWLSKDVCPDCGGEDMRSGPCGGLGQNTACARCGSEFVYVAAAPGFSTRNTERGKPDRARIKAVYGIELS